MLGDRFFFVFSKDGPYFMLSHFLHFLLLISLRFEYSKTHVSQTLGKYSILAEIADLPLPFNQKKNENVNQKCKTNCV